MSDDPQAASGQPGRKGIAVALGVALPLAMSLYTQGQERIEQSRSEEKQDLALQQAALQRDVSQAGELEQRLRADWPDPSAPRDGYDRLCRQFEREVRRTRDGIFGRQSIKTLVTEFDLSVGNRTAPDDTGSVACHCKSQAAGLRELLVDRNGDLKRKLSYAQRAELDERLAASINRCAMPPSSPPSSPPPTRSPWQPDWQPPPQPQPEPQPVSPASVDTLDAPDSTRAAQIRDLRIRVYVQLPQPPDASTQCLKETLERFGYVVPGFEKVGRRAPAATQVRYVRADERPAAQALVADLAQIQHACAGRAGQFSQAKLPGAPRDFSRIRIDARPYHLELWIGASPRPAKTGEKSP